MRAEDRRKGSLSLPHATPRPRPYRREPPLGLRSARGSAHGRCALLSPLSPPLQASSTVPTHSAMSHSSTSQAWNHRRSHQVRGGRTTPLLGCGTACCRRWSSPDWSVHFCACFDCCSVGGVISGALISFVQKGLQYSEIEAHMSEDGTEIVCDEGFSLMKKHVCKAKPTKRKIFNAFDSLDADYGGLEIENALLLRQPLDPQKGDHLGSTGLKHMAVSVAWHPFVASESGSSGSSRNNKRGSSASHAAMDAQQNTLLTANADGSVKVWQYLEEEEERKDAESDAAASSSSGSTTKVPFQKGYFCIRTFEQPPLPAPVATPAVAAPAPESTAPVSALAVAADAAATNTTAAAAPASSSMEDTPEATAAAAAAAAPTASDAAASSPAEAASSSSSSTPAASAAAATSSTEESNKRQRLNDSTAVSTTGAAAADSSSSSSSSAAAAAAASSAAVASCSIDQNRSIVAMDWHVS